MIFEAHSDNNTNSVTVLKNLGFVPNWSFESSIVPRWRYRQVLEALLRRGIKSPDFVAIKEVVQRPLWALYFVFAPEGNLTTAHRFTLAKLRLQGFGIFVVVATKDFHSLPHDLTDMADAVYWKALPGYDFSAYSLGLSVLARRSAGATVLVMNDSVLGPVCDVLDMTTKAPWELTGFTASGVIENHVQSYAFVLKNFTSDRLLRLRTVLFPFFACGGRDDVIACQESRMARVASAVMTVGAYWYLQGGDPTQHAPFELMDAGCPFVKRSLIEPRSSFADKERAQAFFQDIIGQ